MERKRHTYVVNGVPLVQAAVRENVGTERLTSNSWWGRLCASPTDPIESTQFSFDEIKWMDRLSKWYSPGEILIMATGTAGELLEDVKVVGELENLRVIIKDGQVYKNTLMNAD